MEEGETAGDRGSDANQILSDLLLADSERGLTAARGNTIGSVAVTLNACVQRFETRAHFCCCCQNGGKT